MNIISKFWQKIKSVLSQEVRGKDLGIVGALAAAAFSLIKAVADFLDKLMFRNAGALAFYTLFAIVPTLSFMTAIAQVFHFDSAIINFINQGTSSFKIDDTTLSDYVSNYLRNATTGGFMIALGVGALTYSIMSTYYEIDRLFNEIWEKKPRPLKKQVPQCVSWLISITFIIAIFFTIKTNFLADSPALTHVIEGCLVLTFIFTAFKMLPDAKVHKAPALIASFITLLLLMIVTYVFSIFSNIASYHKVYGALAIIPLLMLYMQIAWAVIIFGARLTFSLQYGKTKLFGVKPEEMSRNRKDTTLLFVSSAIINRYLDTTIDDCRNGTSPSSLHESYGIPIRLVIWATTWLSSAGMLNKNASAGDEEERYIPSGDLINITTAQFLMRVHNISAAERETQETDLVPLSEPDAKLAYNAELKQAADVEQTLAFVRDYHRLQTNVLSDVLLRDVMHYSAFASPSPSHDEPTHGELIC